MKSLLTLLFSLLCQLPALAREYSPELAQKTFLHVWNKVNNSFYEESFNGIDWQSVKSNYAGKVTKAQSWPELRSTLNQMLGELKLSHFGISKNLSQASDEAPTHGNYLGLELRLIDQKALIFQIEKNSPAALAGLTPGMILSHFEGQPMAQLIAELELTPQSTPLNRLTATRALLTKLSSPEDGKTTLKTTHSRKIFDFPPDFYQGEHGRMGSEEHIPFSFETRLVGQEQKIRLITFDIFLPQLMLRLNQAIAQAVNEKAHGIIIDLRGNPGGLGIMATGIIGRLIDQELDLGDMNNTSGNFPFHAFPQDGAYLGPLAVLIDSFSASTSEIFSAALQEHKRARLFGRPTTGAVLPSFIEKLPNGDIFQYAIGDFVTSLHKTRLEGKGVTPDELIPLDPAKLRAGIDPDLQAALKWLKKQPKQ